MGEPAFLFPGEPVEEADESMAPAIDRHHLRMLEAMLFAAAGPLSLAEIAQRMPEGIALEPLLSALQADYAERGVNLRRIDDRWAFRTAADVAFVMRRDVVDEKKLSRAAVETLAVIAYHQPVTRAEIEEVRGVSVSSGTLDILLEAGWARLRGRRRTPGRPVTFGTTPEFLDHFGLESIGDLPGLADLKAAGLIEALGTAPLGDHFPTPSDDPALTSDEDPLEDEPGSLDLDAVLAAEDDSEPEDPVEPPDETEPAGETAVGEAEADGFADAEGEEDRSA
jgi:segregation and condensation protein B